MRTKLIDIGNSKGVRIPKPLLEEAGLKKEIDLSLRNGKIVIEPIGRTKTRTRRVNYEYLVSYGALADWNRPEEDEAWAYLQ